MKKRLLLLLLLTVPCFAQLQVTFSTQEELLPGVRGVGRTQEPVSVGVPLPDAAAITSAQQLGCSGSSACQFRWLASWPDGHWKWVQFDYLDSVKAGGIDNSVSLRSGGGSESSNLASDSNVSNPNSGTITVNTGPQGCTFVIQKSAFDVLHSAACGGRVLVNGASAGLVLMGPAFGSNPIADCKLNETCTTQYQSTNDLQSQCVLEQNGPVHAAVRCSGGLKDNAGHKYMGFQVRLHFYAGKQRVRVVTTLKNADDGARGSFPVSYKGYQSFELRLATALTGSNTWTIANETTVPNTGSFTASGQSAYIYQAYSSQYLDSGYCSSSPDAASDLARMSQGGNCTYAQDGYTIVDQSGTIVGAHNDTVSAGGWADVKDSSGGYGIEIGSEYMAQNFPRSLEIMNSGSEVRIGISPDQNLWNGQCNSQLPNCRKIYYQAWPAYKVADLDLIFHAQDLGTSGEVSEFFKMQSPLIARAPVAVYNEAGVFTYPLLSGADEDRYMQSVNPRFVPGSLKDMSAKPGCLQTSDTCLYMPRFYGWAAGGDSNQIESRYANLVHRWIGRGLTGRYLFASWFTRFQEQYAWPRGDRVRWANHTPTSDLTLADGYPSACSGIHGQKVNLCNTGGGEQSGMLPNNYQYAYMDYAGTMENNWQHGHWWSLISYYYMTGDEEANDLLKDGVITEWTSTTAQNNVVWNPSSPPYNLLYAARSIGEHLNGAVRYWQYLQDTNANPNDISNARTVVNNNLSIVYGEGCATDWSGKTYPSGCRPSFALSANGPYARGILSYRGFATGPGDFDNVNRCAPVSGNSFVVASSGQQYTRCVKLFMQGLFLDGLWAYSHIMGSSPASDVSRVRDLAYGVAFETDTEMYVPNLVPQGRGFPSAGQTVYEIGLDQPNQMKWLQTSQESDTYIAVPWINIYLTLVDYTGDTKTWTQHFVNNFNNKGAGSSYNPNVMTDYGSHLSAALIYTLLNPPAQKLQTINLTSAYDRLTGKWKVSWTPPQGVTQYFLKENDSRTIVENIGWNPETDLPVGDAEHSANWFSAAYATSQPGVGDNFIMIAAPSTAKFMMKAMVASGSGTGGGGGEEGGTSTLAWSPQQLNFASVTVGQMSAPQSVTLTNPTSSPSALTITRIQTNGSFSQINNCGSLPTVLAVGASCTISVSFSPQSAGQSTGFLTISDNTSTGSTVNVTLSGIASGHTASIPIPANAWTTFQSSGFPAEVVGYDATVYASAIRRHIVLGKYHHYGSEPNYCMDGWNWDQNRWDILDCGEGFHNEHSMEGGHPVGAFVYMPSRASILYWGGQSGSNQPEQALHTWWWDVVGKVGRDKIGTGQRPGEIKVSAMAYDQSRDIALFYPDQRFQLEIYDPNANMWSTPVTNGLPPRLGLTFPTMDWNSTDHKTYLFGGAAGNNCTSESLTFSNDVYTFDPGTNTWALLPVRPDPVNGLPEGRWYAGFAYDPNDNIFLLAGGQNCVGNNQNGLVDTWKLDMNTVPAGWVRLKPTTNFVLRSAADAPFQKLRYDPDHQAFVMVMGSFDDQSYLGGDWGNYPARIWVYCYQDLGCPNVGTQSEAYVPPVAPVASLNRNARPVTSNNQSWATDTAVAGSSRTTYVGWIETGDPFDHGSCIFHHPYVQAFNSDGSQSFLGFDCTAMDSNAARVERDGEKLSMAVVSGSVWAAWAESNSAEGAPNSIFAKYWDGSTWVGGPLGTRNGVTKAYQGFSQLISVGERPTIAFLQNNRDLYPDVTEAYVDQFDGSAWQPLGGMLNVNAAANAGRVESIGVASDGSQPWACWTEYNIATSASNAEPGWGYVHPAQLYCAHWSGSSWQTWGPLNQNTANWAAEAAVAYAWGQLYVAWTERSNNGNAELFVKSWNGSNWSSVGGGPLNKNSTNGWVFHPRMATDGVKLYLAWEEAITPSIGTTGQPSQLYVSELTGGDWLPLSDTALNMDPIHGTASHSSLMVVNGAPTVAWTEVQAGQLQQAYAKHWNGSGWVLLGIQDTE
jgi:hypothetical protein